MISNSMYLNRNKLLSFARYLSEIPVDSTTKDKLFENFKEVTGYDPTSETFKKKKYEPTREQNNLNNKRYYENHKDDIKNKIRGTQMLVKCA